MYHKFCMLSLVSYNCSCVLLCKEWKYYSRVILSQGWLYTLQCSLLQEYKGFYAKNIQVLLVKKKKKNCSNKMTNIKYWTYSTVHLYYPSSVRELCYRDACSVVQISVHNWDHYTNIQHETSDIYLGCTNHKCMIVLKVK